MKDSPELCPIVLLVLTLCYAGSGHGQPSGSWRDPSPHQVQWATVEPGVRLEVLDGADRDARLYCWRGSERQPMFLTDSQKN